MAIIDKQLTKMEKRLLHNWIINIGGFAKAIILLTKEHDRAWNNICGETDYNWDALDRVDKMSKSITYVRFISKFGVENLLCFTS